MIFFNVQLKTNMWIELSWVSQWVRGSLYPSKSTLWLLSLYDILIEISSSLMAPWNYLTNIKNTTETFSGFLWILDGFFMISGAQKRTKKSSVTCGTRSTFQLLCKDYTINYCLCHCFHMRTFQTPEYKTQKKLFLGYFHKYFFCHFFCTREKIDRKEEEKVLVKSWTYHSAIQLFCRGTFSKQKLFFLMCLCK